MKVVTWANGFGVWYVHVNIKGTKGKEIAKEYIARELRDRGVGEEFLNSDRFDVQRDPMYDVSDMITYCEKDLEDAEN